MSIKRLVDPFPCLAEEQVALFLPWTSMEKKDKKLEDLKKILLPALGLGEFTGKMHYGIKFTIIGTDGYVEFIKEGKSYIKDKVVIY